MTTHDEEWTLDGEYLRLPSEVGPTKAALFYLGTRKRARLAAQSPAMARLLLRFRDYGWMGKDGRAEVDEVLRAAGVLDAAIGGE